MVHQEDPNFAPETDNKMISNLHPIFSFNNTLTLRLKYNIQIMKMKIPFITMLLALMMSAICLSSLQAQHVQVNLTIPPPYPIYLENYLNFTNQTVITIQNTSSETRQIKLVASVTGDNGISAAVKHSFTPNAPLILNPMETRVLTGGQLKALNNNLKESDVDVTGTSKSLLMQTATLPEGSYTVCIEPLDYITSQSYASPAGPGCAYIFITQYDPPEIIVPAFEQALWATTPQFVNFAWTPAGVASFTRYRFELVDMDYNNLLNINDAFTNPSVQKHYQQNNLLIPNLQYDITKPPLTPGHQYAVRVVAYDPSQQTQFKNNGEGPVSTFFYNAPLVVNPNINIPNNPTVLGGNPNPNPNIMQVNFNIGNITLPPPPVDDPPEDYGDCIGTCAVPAPVGPSAPIQQGKEVNVGFFKMNITQLNGNSGEGTIFIEFLKTKVKVVFNNLQVNAGNTMISGQIMAKVDPGSIVSQALANSENSNLEPLYSSLPELLNEVKNNAKKVSTYNGNQAPTGIPFSLDSKQFDMAIVGLIFTPTKAYMNVVMGIEALQNAVTPYLGISQNGIGIRPKGFCDDTAMKISLSQNREIELVNNGGEDWIKMRFNGSGNGEKTYVKFNCSGAQELKIDAEIIFGRHYALPVNQNAAVQNGNVSVAIVQVLNQNLKDWYIENPQFKPSKYFTLPAMQGFRLEASNVIYDQHSNYTPPGMTFHPNHPSSGGSSKLWKGLFIGDLSIRFPEGFMKDGQPLQVNVEDLLMDKTGMWGQISVNNLIQIENGDLGGWAFSIDAFNLDIQESTLASGGFGGNIELPITDLGVPYDIQLAGQNGNEYSFGISPGTDISVQMWIAEMTIGQSSAIKIKKSGNSFIPSAKLNGSISISWTKDKLNGMQNKPAVGKFQLPTLDVEGMSIVTLNGVPKIDNFGLPSLDNLDLPQGEFLAFKINLKQLAIVNNGQGSNGLNLTLELGFDNSGSGGDPLIGGSTTFTLFPKLENKKFKFDKTVLEAVEIEATVGPAELKGGLQLFNSHDVYGEGFRGYINVKMPPLGLEDMSFTLQVGTAPQNFRYWMFDASIKLTTGIACGPGIAIYGFGGGFWYNMTREGPENTQEAVAVNINDMQNVTKNNIDMSAGATANGITYTPSQGTIGFKANVIIGLIGSSAAFNADVGLAMELNTEFGFNYIEFNGAAFLMQDMTDRGKALVSGTVLIKVESKNYNPNGPVLLGEVAVKVNVETLVVDVNADLNLSFMFSPNDWYVNFGSWDTNANPANYDPKTDPYRNRLEIDIPLISANIQFNCYFMVGTTIPFNLPPLPKNVQNFFPGGAGQVNQSTKNITSNGLGFAAGAGLHLDVDFKFAIIYVDIQFDMGFDAIVQKVKGDCGSVTNPGIGGWYAKGQAYAYCHVEGGLEIDIWFFSGKIPFASFTAGALLQVQGPNPTWVNGRIKFQVSILGGLIKVNTQVVADIGEKCDDGAGNPFDDIPIVSYVDPADKAVKVDCYTNPQIVFNFPKVPFKYEVYDEQKEKNVYKGYSVKLKSHKFTYKEKGTNKVITVEMDAPKWANDGYSCLLLPKDILPGLTDITYEIISQGYEHNMNGHQITNQIKTAFPDQIVKGTFKTDSFPDAIRVKDIVYSIPGLGQRYFLKNDNAQGSIQMFKMSCDSLFKKGEATNPEVVYKYKARFIELATNKIYESDCQCINKKISYAIPPGLILSRLYQLDFIRQSHPKTNTVANAKSNEKWRKLGDWEDGNILVPNMNIVIPPQNQNNNINNNMILLPPNQNGNNINNNMQIVNVNPNIQPNNMNIQANVNPGPNFPQNNMNIANNPAQKMIAMEAYDREFVESVKTVKIAEKILFTNYFKNSKYKTKAEKTAQMDEHGQIYSTTYPVVPAHFEGMDGYLNMDDYLIEVPVMLIKTDEGLDQYDVKGFFFSSTDPSNLGNYEDEESMYNINPPIFKLEAAYSPIWLETPYDNETYSDKSIFQQPDEQDFKFEMAIYDPADMDQNEVKYEYYTEGDLRKYLFWPEYNDWKPYLSTYEEEDQEDLIWGNGKFWTGERFKYTAVFEHLKGTSTTKYGLPFMRNDFKYVDKKLPVPQKFGMYNEEKKFIPAAWYSHKIHGHVNFGNTPVYEPEGILNWNDINAEKAKAPQQGNQGNQGNIMNFQANLNGLNPGVQNGMMNQGMQISANQTKYLAIIDYSEWMAKRDHIRMTNKVLYEFREDVCVGCGTNIASLLTQKDGGNKQYPQPDYDPKDQGFDDDPDEAPEVDWKDYRYTFKYLPMRAWLLHYHKYRSRPQSEYRFKLGGKEFLFNVKQYSQNSTWPTQYNCK